MKTTPSILALTAALAIVGPVLAQEQPAPASAPSTDAPAATPPAAPAEVPAPAAVTEPAAPAIVDEFAPPKDKGLVVFYRSSIVGALLGCTVHENDGVVSKLPTGKYFTHVADPGVHTFEVESEAKNRLRLEVEAGEVYYVKCSISMGIMVGRPNLAPSDKAAFEKDGKKLKKVS